MVGVYMCKENGSPHGWDVKKTEKYRVWGSTIPSKAHLQRFEDLPLGPTS
jgi:hypothetical protein